MLTPLASTPAQTTHRRYIRLYALFPLQSLVCFSLHFEYKSYSSRVLLLCDVCALQVSAIGLIPWHVSDDPVSIPYVAPASPL
jgi:hypothetical protein